MTKDPPPRRGAPNRASSELSISTRRGSDVEEEEAVVEVVDGTEPASSLSNGQDEQLDDMESQQLMTSLLPALKIAADDLMQRLKEGDYRHKVFRKITATKRKQFHSVRENYESSKTTAPFVYGLWKVDDDSQANITNTIVRANLVSVLDSLRLIQIDKKGDALSFLRALDAAYEEGLFGEGGTDPVLALRIRTGHFVEHLARQKGRLRTAEFIASVFCKKTNSVDFPSILANGPFRALGGKDDKGAAEVSSKRTHELETVMIQNKKTYGVDLLKRRFPLIKLLGDLEKWALDEYEKARDVDSQEDVFHDAEQGARESSEPDTQVVRRAPVPQSRYVSLTKRGNRSRSSALGPDEAFGARGQERPCC